MKSPLSLLILLLFCGCGPKIGRVVSKEHRSSYSVILLQHIHSGDLDVIIPQTIYFPESWNITVTLDDTNFGTWSCTQRDYENATNGAWFEYGTGVIPEPRSVEKHSL